MFIYIYFKITLKIKVSAVEAFGIKLMGFVLHPAKSTFSSDEQHIRNSSVYNANNILFKIIQTNT